MVLAYLECLSMILFVKAGRDSGEKTHKARVHGGKRQKLGSTLSENEKRWNHFPSKDSQPNGMHCSKLCKR